MTKYLFQTSELGVSDAGIHLLRSGFNHKTIKWNQINSVKIERGKELHNWWIIFVLGAVLLAVGIYLTARTVDILMNKEHAERYAKMLLFLLVPCIGAYFLINSLRTGPVLKINYDAYQKDMFPLKPILRDNQLNEFRLFLTEKLGSTKVRV